MKTLGSISTLKFFVTSPIVMNFHEMSPNQLTLLVGVNGVGKSFINATAWGLTTLLSVIIESRKNGNNVNPTEIARLILGSTFKSKVTGTIGATYESSSTIDVAFDKDGEVIHANANIPDNIETGTRAVYMSSSFRLFSSISQYLQMRQECKGHEVNDVVNELRDHFMLYDILYVEALIAKMPLELSETMKAYLTSFDIKEKIESINVDLEKCDFYAILEDKSRISLSKWFGSGHQALLNMFIGAHLFT